MPLLASPAFLLVSTGILLGLSFPLAKFAGQAGIPGPVWAAAMSGAAAAGLALFLAGRRLLAGAAATGPLDLRHLRYFLVTATISYVIPNLVITASIPRLGSGLTAIMFTLSPFFTLLFSRLAGLGLPGRLEYAGIAIAFLGALMVASARGEIGRPAEWSAVALGLLIPLSLAAGNVYRTLDWPGGTDSTWLAFGSNAAAVLLLALVAMLGAGPAALMPLAEVPHLIAGQVAAGTAMFLLFFRLQRVGGPVLLSQIGAVAAATGIGIGAGLLGERYPVTVWLGCGLIAAGLVLTALARRKP